MRMRLAGVIMQSNNGQQIDFAIYQMLANIMNELNI